MASHGMILMVSQCASLINESYILLDSRFHLGSFIWFIDADLPNEGCQWTVIVYKGPCEGRQWHGDARYVARVNQHLWHVFSAIQLIIGVFAIHDHQESIRKHSPPP